MVGCPLITYSNMPRCATVFQCYHHSCQWQRHSAGAAADKKILNLQQDKTPPTTSRHPNPPTLFPKGHRMFLLKKKTDTLWDGQKKETRVLRRDYESPFNSTMKRASANYQFDYKNREGPTHVPVTVTSGHPKFSHSQPATRAPNNNRRWEKWFPPTNHNKTKVETLGGL